MHEVLHRDGILHIFSFLDAQTLCKSSSVCKKWKELTEEHLLWTLQLSKHFNRQKHLWKSSTETDPKDVFKCCHLTIVLIQRLLSISKMPSRIYYGPTDDVLRNSKDRRLFQHLSLCSPNEEVSFLLRIFALFSPSRFLQVEAANVLCRWNKDKVLSENRIPFILNRVLQKTRSGFLCFEACRALLLLSSLSDNWKILFESIADIQWREGTVNLWKRKESDGLFYILNRSRDLSLEGKRALLALLKEKVAQLSFMLAYCIFADRSKYLFSLGFQSTVQMEFKLR